MSECCKELLAILEKCKKCLLKDAMQWFCVFDHVCAEFNTIVVIRGGRLTLKLFVIDLDNSGDPKFEKSEIIDAVSYVLSWPQR